MKEVLSDQQNEAILQALDEAINNGPWEESNFLRAIGKNLNHIRENFVNQLGTRTKAQIQAETQLANRMALRSGQQEVFVSLYSADGSNIQSWERIVANLPRQMISRPIYASEEHVKAIIKTKENKINEAYLGIFINQSGVIALPPDKALSDKLGNLLLTLKDRTLDLDNISRFVHVSGVYHYDRGRLLKEASA
ncbi:Dot/Icm secretion system protein IcmQ [Legionella lytica]|uniref:Dot/Icm secretion system protein IcmQ n=1 Tax=Legionella lytica TaxID=96232 RepID=A0ABY4Y9K3_9GAMM|nr:Dot/Icm secretion system protein IcmQ [Legionella lytica]USQ14132.1 Dot/Icm secretion system protein IcmQ [Legionella lytica]